MAISWWVNIENSAGTRQGAGPLLPVRWRSTAVLDRAGSFEFEIPATDQRAADLLQLKYLARCYAVIDGATVQVGSGIIEDITIRVSNGIPMRVVSGPDLLGELRRLTVDKRVVTGLAGYYYLPTFAGDDEIPYKLLANYANAKAASSWSLLNSAGSTIGSGTAVTDYEIYARFRDDSVLNSLIRVAEICGEHFRIGSSGRQVQWLGRTSDFAASGVRAIYDVDATKVGDYDYIAQIADISHKQDAQGIVNRLILYGAGEGENRLTVRPATEWPDGTAVSGSPHNRTIDSRNYYLVTTTTSAAVDLVFNCLEDATSSAAYGVHEMALQINNVSPLSNTTADVQNAANQLVIAGFEYLLQNAEPISSYSLRLVGCNTILRPGTTIPVQAQRWVDGEKPIDINDTLNILSATVELDAYGVRTSDLVVSDGSRQPVTGSDIVTAQAAKSYTMRSYPQMGPNESTIGYGPEDMDRTHDAVLRFWLGNAITTLERVILYFRFDPLRSTVMRHDDMTDVAHSHTWPIYENTITTNIGLDTLGRIARGGSGGAVSNNIATSSGGYHLHPLHLGILEETSGNTLDPTTEVDIEINGGSPTNGVVDESDGWYSLDITDDLIDTTTLRPSQTKNEVTFADGRSAVNISSISKSVVTVTVTTSSAHGLSSGDAVWIAGTSAYNGHHANITVSTSTVFTFLALDGSGSEATGTVIKYKTARVQAQIERRMSIQSIAYR